MASSKAKTNGRSKCRPHIQLLKFVLESDEFGQLSGNAVKLLIELHKQYNGFNNGDMCATWSKLRLRGWKSKGTLSRSLKELSDAGFIILSRISCQKRSPNLYALTYLAIDECKGKVDIKDTRIPSHSWRNNKLIPRIRGINSSITPHVVHEKTEIVVTAQYEGQKQDINY